MRKYYYEKILLSLKSNADFIVEVLEDTEGDHDENRKLPKQFDVFLFGIFFNAYIHTL